jgi:RNA:NAD 2'-phosphotransferase (TPT1/KptA family)
MSLHRCWPRIRQLTKQSGLRFFSETAAEAQYDKGPFGDFTTKLNWLLRHGALKENLEIRPDGYVRLTDVVGRGLQIQQFLIILQRECLKLAGYGSPEFDDFLQQDTFNNGYKRFKSIEDFDLRTGANSVWIRSKRGHSIEVQIRLLRFGRF